MKLIILWLSIITTACSSAEHPRPRVDFELEEYKEEFTKTIMGKRLIPRIEKTEMYFADLAKEKNNLIGHCNGFDLSGYTQIRIDFAYWQKATPMSKAFTVYHEMGHCICYSPHSEISDSTGIAAFFERLAFKLGIFKRKGFMEDGCPASIMHPVEFSESCMMRHYFHYINDLQKRCK